MAPDELFGGVDVDGFTDLAREDSNGDGVIDAGELQSLADAWTSQGRFSGRGLLVLGCQPRPSAPTLFAM